MKKSFSIVLILIVIIVGVVLSSKNSSANCKFNCKSFNGKIIDVTTSIKGSKTVYLENHKNYPLGSYLNPECGKIIEKGDSIFKIKGSMKLSIFRNGNYLCGDYNSYYKSKKCSCD